MNIPRFFTFVSNHTFLDNLSMSLFFWWQVKIFNIIRFLQLMILFCHLSSSKRISPLWVNQSILYIHNVLHFMNTNKINSNKNVLTCAMTFSIFNFSTFDISSTFLNYHFNNCFTCQFHYCYSNRGLLQWWKPTERYPTVFAAC